MGFLLFIIVVLAMVTSSFRTKNRDTYGDSDASGGDSSGFGLFGDGGDGGGGGE
ncbi:MULTISPECIES: hypothetical protein [Pontibacillus]|uniref:Uncharacterized protein n=1 Tax=Pontibacillus chungwhensis TaxID=265426 RepID=A0ABY8UUX8_9BACI|nr:MULTISPECIES: hypothetical protein [Pontibacillus]MCD5323169.1 hypothetical protein [Pontibacillus sp. HN14]WIF96556.1 hypothetical protein QNI29_12425 [Pontibacillus chungwhensis]